MTRLQQIVTTALGLAAACGFALPVLAQPAAKQAAIVEDVSGRVPGIEAFDFVTPGQTITLPAGATLTLGYLASCLRETITGGSVTVGETASTVRGGRLQQEQLKCATAMNLGSGQAGKSGAMVFRGTPGSGRKRAGMPEPATVVMYTAPIFVVEQPGQLNIERLDIEETVQVFQVSGKLFDLGKHSKVLDAGGTYRATLNGKSTVFQISLQAAEGSGPLLLRLVRF